MLLSRLSAPLSPLARKEPLRSLSLNLVTPHLPQKRKRAPAACTLTHTEELYHMVNQEECSKCVKKRKEEVDTFVVLFSTVILELEIPSSANKRVR